MARVGKAATAMPTTFPFPSLPQYRYEASDKANDEGGEGVGNGSGAQQRAHQFSSHLVAGKLLDELQRPHGSCPVVKSTITPERLLDVAQKYEEN